MKRIAVFAIAWFAVAIFGSAQQNERPQDKLHAELHGYVTQAFLYSNHNNWNTTDSTSGSPDWTEAVLTATSEPFVRLHLGAQTRYFRLGTYGNKITLDWASAEFKINDHIGVRAGKVKTPLGILNETQDIDPAHLWILLPQSIYPIASRSADLAHTGGIVFGNIPLGERFGKIQYRIYGGRRSIPVGNGLVQPLVQAGIHFPHGIKGPAYGASLRWKTPLRGLIAGLTEGFEKPSALLYYGPLPGTINVPTFNQTFFFTQYEHNRFMAAGEYSRFPTSGRIQFPGIPVIAGSRDLRAFYIMTTYKLTGKLSAGTYYSSATDKAAFKAASSAFHSVDPNASFQKDVTLSARYDFNSYAYLKAEQHLLHGTMIGYSQADNLNGLSKNSQLSLLKLGASF